MLLSNKVNGWVGLLASSLLVSCGGGAQVNLDVVLGSNSDQNVLLKISQDMQIGLSAGVYFVMDELKTAPVSVDDQLSGGDTYSEPDLSSSVGNDPLQNEFKISTATLNPMSFYRIKMIARDANGNITHTGTGDCPVKISLKESNVVKICFGENNLSDPPLCPGLTKFTDCPGI
jgi:hypothetical protein